MQATLALRVTLAVSDLDACLFLSPARRLSTSPRFLETVRFGVASSYVPMEKTDACFFSR